ncbi:MAG: Hsp20/alpha crystallin family protein [Verrucomicrobiae bacterium]|nr:Hsp20/alpha crystallin family protein [Verrucomicrobiae bacterium]
MNTLTHWNPFREMENLLGLANRPYTKSDRTLADWAPLTDIVEDEKQFLIKLELPEIRKDDVKVTIHEGVLTIRGERKFENEEKNKKYHRIERAYGSFERSFALPETADEKTIKADFKDGVLNVTIGKAEVVAPKQIEVKVS